MNIDAQEIIEYQEELASDRSTWEDSWQDIQDYVCPNRPPILDEDEPGTDRSAIIFDSTPVRASERLASSLASMLTNPSTEWLRMESYDTKLNTDPMAIQYFDELTTFLMLYYDMSNFYNEINIVYQDLCTLGTACMYVERGNTYEQPMLFSARHMKEIYVEEDKNGMVDVVMRRFHMTGRQLKQCVAYDDEYNLSKYTKQKCDDDPQEKIELLHAVFPREDITTGGPKQRMKYASIWIDIEQREIIKDSGYQVFPYLVPRWLKSSGEIYGRSPALSSLADIKQLNEMVKTVIRTGQRIADPILMAPDDGFFNIDTEPGGISFYRAGTQDRLQPLDLGNRVPITFSMIQEVRDRISDAFLMSQLQIIDKKDMTAEEVRARVQDQLRSLGPTSGRLQQELLSPLVKLTLHLMRPVLPKVPMTIRDSLGKKPLRFRYISPMAKAQKMTDAQSTVYLVNNTIAWAKNSGRVDVLDNLNLDEATRIVADSSSTPPIILNSPEAVAAMRQQRAQAQQAALNQAQQSQNVDKLAGVSGAMKDIASAKEREASIQ